MQVHAANKTSISSGAGGTGTGRRIPRWLGGRPNGRRGPKDVCVCVWGEGGGGGGGFRVGQGLRASSAIGDYCSHVFLFIFEPGTS